MAVISFVVLAGGSFRFGFLPYRILPVDASITTAALELISTAETVDSKQLIVISKKTIIMIIETDLFLLTDD
jgi:hypothetical protein